MREPILKAVAMPPKVFWAPMLPAVVNFSVQMAIMMVFLGGFPGLLNPIMFIPTILIGHIGIIVYGVRDPHLSKLMQSYGPFMTFYKNVYRSRGHKLAP